MIDVSPYQRLSWQEGAFDCWGLVRLFYRQEFGIELPRVQVQSGNIRAVIRELRTNPARQLFLPLVQPIDGCVVELAMSSDPDHVGIYLERPSGPCVLHNERGMGVGLTPLWEVLNDYSVTGYYQYVR